MCGQAYFVKEFMQNVKFYAALVDLGSLQCDKKVLVRGIQNSQITDDTESCTLRR